MYEEPAIQYMSSCNRNARALSERRPMPDSAEGIPGNWLFTILTCVGHQEAWPPISHVTDDVSRVLQGYR